MKENFCENCGELVCCDKPTYGSEPKSLNVRAYDILKYATLEEVRLEIVKRLLPKVSESELICVYEMKNKEEVKN